MSKAATALQIMQIANMGMATLFDFLTRKQEAKDKGVEYKPSRGEIKNYILTSTMALEIAGKLVVKDRKKFDKDINKQAEVIESMLKNMEFK